MQIEINRGDIHGEKQQLVSKAVHNIDEQATLYFLERVKRPENRRAYH